MTAPDFDLTRDEIHELHEITNRALFRLMERNRLVTEHLFGVLDAKDAAAKTSPASVPEKATTR